MRTFVPSTFKRRGGYWSNPTTEYERKRKKERTERIRREAGGGNSQFIIFPPTK